jgi:hypothetical protein
VPSAGPEAQNPPSSKPPGSEGGANSLPDNPNNENRNGEPGNNGNQQNQSPTNNQNNDKQSGQPSNNNDQNNNPPDNNQNSGNEGAGSKSPGIGGIIASIINQPWMPRPAASAPANDGNPSGPAQGSSPGKNQGNPAALNPEAIISNIMKLNTALGSPPPPPAPTGKSGQNGPIRIEPSAVVIGNQLVPIPSASDQTKVVVVSGQSYTVGATAVVGPYTTVPLPAGGGSLGLSPSPIVVGGVPVFVDGTSQAIISGQTYSIGPSAKPTTIVVNGQTISLGSGGVGFASTTLMGSDYSRTEIGGVAVGLGASEVVISGTTYNIGPSATATTIVVNGQTISIGSGGIGFASTTLRGSGFTTTAVDGVTFGIGASQVVISGKTYNIGPSATPTTIVLNGETISIGPSGVGFASTTIRATGASDSRNTSPSTFPSRTGGEASAPTPSNGAVSSSNAFVGAVVALLIAGVVGFILL